MEIIIVRSGLLLLTMHKEVAQVLNLFLDLSLNLSTVKVLLIKCRFYWVDHLEIII